MFCPNCGAKTEDGALFCGNCGLSLAEEHDPAQAAERGGAKDSVRPANQDFFHTTAGKVIAAAAVICLAGTVAMNGMAQYNAGHSETIGTAEEFWEEDTDVIYDAEDLTEEQQAMTGPMGALICHYRDSPAEEDILHTWDNTSEDAWGTFQDLFNDFTYLYEDDSERILMDPEGQVRVSEDFLQDCASALYADFDGILPEIPDLADADVGIRGKEGDYYCFGTEDRGEDGLDISICSWTSHADGSDTVLVEACNSLGEIVESDQFELVENSWTQDQETPVFVYSIWSVTKFSEEFPEDDVWTDDDVWAEDDVWTDDDVWTEDDVWAEDDVWTDDDAWMEDDTWDEDDEEGFSETDEDWDEDDTWDEDDEEDLFETDDDWDEDDTRDEDDEEDFFETDDTGDADDTGIDDDTGKAEADGPDSDEPDFEVPDTDAVFADSWEMIQSCGLSATGQDAEDPEDGCYICTSLSFLIDGSTLVDAGDYYEVQAVFTEEPFYEGVLRIRKDAVTGDNPDPEAGYETVTADFFESQNGRDDSCTFNYTVFDQDGYVTGLIRNGS